MTNCDSISKLRLPRPWISGSEFPVGVFFHLTYTPIGYIIFCRNLIVYLIECLYSLGTMMDTMCEEGEKDGKPMLS